MLVRSLLEEDELDSEILCRLWSLNVMNAKYPHFSQTPYLFSSLVQPAGHMHWASRFPGPSPALYRPRLPTTGPLLLCKALRPDHSSTKH